MTNLAAIRELLMKIAGVCPSTHWLEDCLVALQLSNTTVPTDLEAASATVLEQILHHDLRDVVRTFCNDDDSSSASCEAAMQLRRAVEQSKTGETCKAILPASFRLLVQVEEFLDVSCNAETRLAVGPSSTVPTGNQDARCLKLCYADGYCSTGSSWYTENNNDTDTQLPLVAMEVTPIAAMSANSFAGLKVLLTGPMTIRHGMAAWHAGNATVLGGRVHALVVTQQQALQLAKQRAGHGVDPTVKALIWNHQQPQDDEDGTWTTSRYILRRVVDTRANFFVCILFSFVNRRRRG